MTATEHWAVRSDAAGVVIAWVEDEGHAKALVELAVASDVSAHIEGPFVDAAAYRGAVDLLDELRGWADSDEDYGLEQGNRRAVVLARVDAFLEAEGRGQ